jgi:hypothetical protein
MSALGHKQTFCAAETMSALPPKADIRWGDQNVRPQADIAQLFDHLVRGTITVLGAVGPSALAVQRVIGSSILRYDAVTISPQYNPIST